jgi:hypothetical protein
MTRFEREPSDFDHDDLKKRLATGPTSRSKPVAPYGYPFTKYGDWLNFSQWKGVLIEERQSDGKLISYVQIEFWVNQTVRAKYDVNFLWTITGSTGQVLVSHPITVFTSVGLAGTQRFKFSLEPHNPFDIIVGTNLAVPKWIDQDG